MRRPFIAGNWKMNLLIEQSVKLAQAVKVVAGDVGSVDVAVAPTFASLAGVLDVLKGSKVSVAAQTCHWETSGAYTGEVSAEMVKDMGCSHVIIGHSERRQYFGETDEWVNRKIHAAHRAGLLPIVCIGETLDQREAGDTFKVIDGQLTAALKDVPKDKMSELTVAYEPVWAIGTGKTATPEQAQEVHAHLRALLAELYDDPVAQQVRIQYGGSVKPANVRELMAKPDIDGALVGGASLKAESFEALIRFEQ